MTTREVVIEKLRARRLLAVSILESFPDSSCHFDKLWLLCSRVMNETRNLPEVEKWDEDNEQDY